MLKRKQTIMKVAAFLIALVPIAIQPRSGLLWGEPELPKAMMKK